MGAKRGQQSETLKAKQIDFVKVYAKHMQEKERFQGLGAIRRKEEPTVRDFNDFAHHEEEE